MNRRKADGGDFDVTTSSSKDDHGPTKSSFCTETDGNGPRDSGNSMAANPSKTPTRLTTSSHGTNPDASDDSPQKTTPNASGAKSDDFFEAYLDDTAAAKLDMDIDMHAAAKAPVTDDASLNTKPTSSPPALSGNGATLTRVDDGLEVYTDGTTIKPTSRADTSRPSATVDGSHSR